MHGSRYQAERGAKQTDQLLADRTELFTDQPGRAVEFMPTEVALGAEVAHLLIDPITARHPQPSQRALRVVMIAPSGDEGVDGPLAGGLLTTLLLLLFPVGTQNDRTLGWRFTRWVTRASDIYGSLLEKASAKTSQKASTLIPRQGSIKIAP
jgi:hypothetical protein